MRTPAISAVPGGPRRQRGSYARFGALRHRNFRLFWAGQLVSLVGTWMQTVAQSWLVLQLTNDPLWLGIVAAAQFTPVLIFGLFGGVIADQLPKRRTLVVTQTASMLLAFALSAIVASGITQVWHILVLAVLLGLTNAVDMPVRQSFVIEMVGREDVANAVGLNSAVFNAARIVGPAVAGILIGAFGVATAFFINGVSFIAVIAGLLWMRDSELLSGPVAIMPHSVRGVVENLAEGVRYVRETRIVLLAVVVVGLVSTVAMNFNVLIPALARDVLDVGATGYGLLMAASGIGALTAALAIAVIGRPGPRLLVGGALLLGVAEVAVAASRVFSVSIGLMFLAGLGSIAMAATANTLIQLAVPDRLRGRVMSVYTTVFAGSTPIGGLMAGGIASAMGAPAGLLLGGGVAVVVALGGVLSIRSLTDKDVRPAGPSAGRQVVKVTTGS